MKLNSAFNFRRLASGLVLASVVLAGGCASESGVGSMFTTGSIGEPAPVAKASVDPACTTLATQIETLRKEGAVARLEKAADGKTQSVSVQRAALAKQSQLNKANADYMAKCGTAQPVSTVAAAPAAAPAAAATPAKAATPAAQAAAAKSSGVTVAAPAAVVPAPKDKE